MILVMINQFMTLGKASWLPVILNINHVEIRESQKLVLLGLTIDNRFTFKGHIDILCRNDSYKLHAFHIIRKYLITEKEELLHNAFINIQFNYASVIMSLLFGCFAERLFKDQKKSVNVFE